MHVLTKRVSEEIVMDQSTRLVILEAGPDKVIFGILDGGRVSEESCKVTVAHPEERTGKTVKIIAPYGEEIEIDC